MDVRSERSGRRALRGVCALVILVLLAMPGRAQGQTSLEQVDIPGPPGSGAFGTSVTALPNGNFVVTDPLYDDGATPDVGAVSLYDGDTLERISTLTGRVANDHAGSGGVIVLANGNFLVYSPAWDDGSRTDVGAVTWVSAELGLEGQISPANSFAGVYWHNGVLPLANGNYVVRSWVQGARLDAVTWGSGTAGLTGTATLDNSLVWSEHGGELPLEQLVALADGDHVLVIPLWDDGDLRNVGAVTWLNGSGPTVGAVSAANSLVGTQAYDRVGLGGIMELAGGDFVVASPYWKSAAGTPVGAATWASGDAPTAGPVTAANSLTGSTFRDDTGQAIVPLANGHYVVASPGWDNGGVQDVGAVTWCSGDGSTTGPVTNANSLVGSTAGDQIGGYVIIEDMWQPTIAPLVNGNYVVASRQWDNGAAADAGAATWGNGAGGTVGPITAANSSVGTASGDGIGKRVVSLNNSNYVVGSPGWNAQRGAATWGSGAGGTVGPVSAANSRVGTNTGDQMGMYVTALANGNYVASTSTLNHPVTNVPDVGAASWGDGLGGTVGKASPGNSLMGTSPYDRVGSFDLVALANGNYVVPSFEWDDGAAIDVGAATWGDGTAGTSGEVSAGNSLVGRSAYDKFGYGPAILPLANGNYVIRSDGWGGEPAAATWVNGAGAAAGRINSENSLIGAGVVATLPNGDYLVGHAGGLVLADGSVGLVGDAAIAHSIPTWSGVFAYDALHNRVIVGRPDENVVTVARVVHGQMILNIVTRLEE